MEGLALLHSATKYRIAVLGVGRIGLPVVANLTSAGHHVRAFDIRSEVAAQANIADVEWVESAPAAVAGVDVLLTVLPGSPELGSLMLGSEQLPRLLDGMPSGSTWIDLTSASPDLGVTLAAAARSRGIGYLDAAVGGGVDAARNAALTLYVGGDRALLDRWQGLLGAIAEPDAIHYMGSAGSGYLTKLLVNLLWFGQAVAVGEALLLGQRAGLEPGRLQEVLAVSAASSELVRSHLPALLDGDYLTTFGLDRCVEELDSVGRLADEYGTPFDLSAAVVRTYRDAFAHFGTVDGELMGVAYLEHQTRTQLRRGPTVPLPPDQA